MCRSVETELLVELGNAAAGIDQLLLAREEGVTLRAHFYLDVFLGRTCLNHITAGACNRSLLIIGMDSFLHCSCSPLSGSLVAAGKPTNATVMIPHHSRNGKCFFTNLSRNLCGKSTIPFPPPADPAPCPGPMRRLPAAFGSAPPAPAWSPPSHGRF